MSISIQTYPSIHVFILFAIVALLTGFGPIYFLAYALEAFSSASPESNASGALLQFILPTVLLADCIIVKKRIYREDGGISTATIICALSGMFVFIAIVFSLWIFTTPEPAQVIRADNNQNFLGEFMKFDIFVGIIGAIAGWLTAFFTLPAKPIPPEEH